jgi:hypothetical protein
VEKVFKTIPDSTKEGNIPTKENIENITHIRDNYRSHIIELMALLQPSTPPEVRSQRMQEVTDHKENIAQSFQEIIELYNKSAQLWKSL